MDNQEIINNLLNPDMGQKVQYVWDEDFQRVIVGLLLCDRFFLAQSRGLIKPAYLTNETHQMICRIVFDYFEKYDRKMPSKVYVKQEITDRLRNQCHNKDVDYFNTLKLHYLGELHTIYDYYSQGGVGDMMPALDSSEAILDRITAFAKMQAMKIAFAQCQQLIQKHPEDELTWAKVDDILREARLVERETDLGLDYFNTLEERYERMARAADEAEVFSSGFDTIDRAIHGGGLMRGEIGAWMGKPGAGKTYVKDTLTLMYDGTIKKVQDIVVGDLVMGDDSTPRKVLATHKLWDKVYEVKPVKGDSYFVNSKHILSLKNSHRIGIPRKNRPTKRNKNPPFFRHPAKMGDTDIFNISVEDWFKQSKRFKTKMKGWRTGVEFKEKSVVIDPYILGIWLGDGSSGQAQLTNADSHVYEEWRVYGEKLGLKYESPDGLHHNLLVVEGKTNKFCDQLRHYDLKNNKHIPHDYKTNSREKRLQLLAGLIDTDGSEHNKCYEISQKSKVLADDILFLARSLGFAAYANEEIKKDQNGTEGLYYRIGISGNCDQIPVKIPYKVSGPRLQTKRHCLTGINVIEHDRYDEFYGFETDGNHLYLLSDFTVVHNSLALVTASVKSITKGKKVLYISTEMDTDRIATRFDAQMTLIGQHELMLRKQEVWAALYGEVKDYEDKRRLIIKQFPSGTADVNTIRAYHAQCVTYGFRPDLMIVDYVGDMKDTPGMPTWESKFCILRDLRGFGKIENHCTLTAIQPNRGVSDLTLEDFLDESKQGGSFMQNQVLDAFWTLNQVETEQRAGVGRVYVAKTRNGKSRFFFKICYNYEPQTLNLHEVSDEQYRMRMNRVKDMASESVQIDQIVTGGPEYKAKKQEKWEPSDGERVQ